MSHTVNTLYALAGELCQIEFDLEESWTFALVAERQDVLREIMNLARREVEVRPATSLTGRKCYGLYAD